MSQPAANCGNQTITRGTTRPYIGRSRQFKRSRNGCLNCRHRKKKCGEERPRCLGCRRNNLNCTWQADQNETAAASPRLSDGTIASPDEGPLSGRASPLLLQHYVTTTATMLPMPLRENAFLREFIPIASVDDMVMHSVLAVSGAHMNFRNASPGTIQEATLDHYSTLVRQILVEVSELKTTCVNKLARLLLVLVMLCHFEAISGSNKGAIFCHLSASREIIVEIQSRQSTEPLGLDSATHFGLGLELYAYLTVANCLTPYGLLQERMFSLDSFITSPSSLAVYSTFGTMFAGLHDLFALIPQTSLLFSQRLMEQESGILEPTSVSVELHEKLQLCLEDWKLRQQDPGSSSSSDYCEGGLSKVSKILQLGIEIYLIAAMEGSSILNPKIVCQFQSHLDVIHDIGLDLDCSQWSATLLWPVIISGSCTIQKQQQETLSKALRESRYHGSGITPTL
ncbi:fungal-specific transcription factor domain-containing protein [Ilyonectria robusta]|uniref:fungal-specific transcription factor domain-containing protein n=1 Tax=Ilyonectria robusta TaxID=1079257 RepID=UPI001E8E4BC5|nr:fungal-specific transcription factor domain-containing protein [Ilyonectria robusta]KAH8672317.1 fungal-specific transcription factor domain-containing protein [Ilyonectria robusta]